VVGERPLRNARCLTMVAHAGTDVAALKHDLRPLPATYLDSKFCSYDIIRPYIVKIKSTDDFEVSPPLSRIHSGKFISCSSAL